MAALNSRGGGRRRRAMNEINMVPFIDVMLVLLIIFMVSAPLITTATIDVPTVGKARQAESRKIDVQVALDGSMKLASEGNERSITLKELAANVRAAQAGDAQVPVVIAADRNVKYDTVVKVMDTLQRAGIQRVGLSVKAGG
ncbi:MULTISPECIES: biopolymer transporter ExbD [Aquincola]|uniref:biopolymer transporter ExbD n=1 Tax=Aquincola TaxID=391952 RepID=UPI0006151460|nr:MULTISPECIES: biopolymer transporter ExbD [Aquincola]MCR5865008.1 biopolymer transporter ExbD [Aquincola sp. J276]